MTGECSGGKDQSINEFINTKAAQYNSVEQNKKVN